MLLVSIMKRNYNTIQEIIDEFGIIEIVRGGRIAISRSKMK